MISRPAQWAILAGVTVAAGVWLGATALAQPGSGATPAATLAPATPAAQAQPAKPKKVQVKHAEHLNYDSAAKVYHLSGNVVLTQEDMTLSADFCDYDDRNNSAVATGHLTITDPDSTLTGDQVKADFTQKLAQVIGNVTIVTQKKRKEGEQQKGFSEYREKKTTITCPQIDYFYADDRKQATVAGPLKAVQDDKTVWADKASYDGIRDTVTLEGNVRVLTDAGSEFRCPKATISLKDDTIEAENITGVAVEEKSQAATPEASATPVASATPEASATPAPSP